MKHSNQIDKMNTYVGQEQTENEIEINPGDPGLESFRLFSDSFQLEGFFFHLKFANVAHSDVNINFRIIS